MDNTEEELEGFQKTFLEELSRKYRCNPSGANLTIDQLRQVNILDDLPPVWSYQWFDIASAGSLVKLCLASTERTTRRRYSSYTVYDSICICIFPFTRDFGRTIIRTEKFLDKFAEAFGKAEFDFNQFPEFSSRYYCLSNHPEKLKSALDKEVASLFENFKLDISVEFSDTLCFLKTPYFIRERDKNLALVEFALGLQKLIGERIQSESL